MDGTINYDDAPTMIQSWARKYIHESACAVLERQTKEDRTALLQSYPPSVQDLIRKEVYRVWELRKRDSGWP